MRWSCESSGGLVREMVRRKVSSVPTSLRSADWWISGFSSADAGRAAPAAASARAMARAERLPVLLMVLPRLLLALLEAPQLQILLTLLHRIQEALHVFLAQLAHLRLLHPSVPARLGLLGVRLVRLPFPCVPPLVLGGPGLARPAVPRAAVLPRIRPPAVSRSPPLPAVR